ncbi:MAG: GNAT family protein [bacterium]|nr:GNAT family protein [bacterium]
MFFERKHYEKTADKNSRVVFLEGKHLYLRPPQLSDVPYFVRWFNNPEITRFLNQRYPMSEMEEKKWLENLSNRNGDIILVIVLKGKTPAKDRPIGNIGIHRIERENGVATTGAAIGEKDCWEKGYGTEAKMILLNYAFDTLNLRKIYSKVFAYNGRSRRYSEKCGYVLEATLPKHHFRNGAYVDELILAVYAETWRVLWKKTKKKYVP